MLMNVVREIIPVKMFVRTQLVAITAAALIKDIDYTLTALLAKVRFLSQ